MEALLLGPLLLRIFQPITDPLGPGVVVAAVADEDGAHDAGAEAASGQITWASLAWPLMGYRGTGDLPNARHHLAAERLGGRQKLAGGGSGEWPCWIVQSVQDRNKTGYLAGNSFAE